MILYGRFPQDLTLIRGQEISLTLSMQGFFKPARLPLYGFPNVFFILS